MDSAFMALLAGLAAVDSLNPFSIAAQAYLLGTPSSTPRSLVFLAGTWLAYFLGGLLLVRGLQAFIASILPGLPFWTVLLGEVTLGLVCIGLSGYLWRCAKHGKMFTPPKHMGLRSTALFAVATTLSDLPTAVPYFAAAAQIVTSQPNCSGSRMEPLCAREQGIEMLELSANGQSFRAHIICEWAHSQISVLANERNPAHAICEWGSAVFSQDSPSGASVGCREQLASKGPTFPSRGRGMLLRIERVRGVAHSPRRASRPAACRVLS